MDIHKDAISCKSLSAHSMTIPPAYLYPMVMSIVLLIMPPSPALAQVESQEYGGTRVDFTVARRRAFVIKPHRSGAPQGNSWVWYAPTLVTEKPRTGGYPNRSLTWLATRLLDRGVWIAGVDVGESYGNRQGRRVYTHFYKYVQEEYGLSPRPCLLPQSRGGLMLYDWAAEHANNVRCIVGIYPVSNLESWPGLGSARLQEAYGMSEAELRKHLRQNNPVDRLAPLARARVPIFHIHGDADKVVSLPQNTLELVKRYKALGGEAEVEVVHGKGHEEVPAFFQSERLIDFLFRFLSPSRPEVP